MTKQPAAAKWYDNWDSVVIEFCVEDSKHEDVIFDKNKFEFSCVSGKDNSEHRNTVDLFGEIDCKGSTYKRTDRSVLCCLRKAEAGKAWPRLSKDKTKFNWLTVNFNNWKDWEEEVNDDVGGFDKFSEMMNNMGGVDMPDSDDGDEQEQESVDSDNCDMPGLI
ncbi:prostaglandin E synthase 3 [Brachionichthys hirsutus]|uniref:prostaglandin E synthase 3 n=1 Tax=Brachionichthys hirsutus TaxID=412623 RepID=UPI00360493C3